MLNTKKAPALAVMGREGTSAGASKGVWENSISSSVFWEPHPLGKSYQKATRQGGDYGAACENMYPCDTAGGLTHGRGWGMLKVPKKHERRTASAIPVFSPRAGRSTGKSIAESSAYHALPEIYSAGACLYWQVRCPGQPQGPGSPLVWLGSTVPASFF